MKLYRCLALMAVCLCALTSVANAQVTQWKPVDPAQLSMKEPVVEKDADAEALFWEVYINTASSSGTDFTHYVRIKVFTDRGKESQSKIDIPYLSTVSIKDVAARAIKPDGTIVELKKEEIFDKELIKAGRLKLKTKSFALPGVEAGTIIEYRWREEYDYITNYVKMELQRDVPAQIVRYYLKPNPYVTVPMRTASFQANVPAFVKEKDGYYKLELTNVPAYREEPRMPPEDQVKSWMLVFYAPDVRKTPAEFWKEEGKRLFDLHKGEMKVNDDIRRAAAEAIGANGESMTSDQKLAAIFGYCKTKIKNVNDDASGLNSDQLNKLKENRSAADTLKRGYGTGYDINLLFAAMASAAGFDSRFALIGDRSRKFFEPEFLDTYFMRGFNVAVKAGDGWRFFDPGSNYVGVGMLRWQEEGIKTLITDPKEPVFVETPITPAEKSLARRRAKLRLSEDGTLEGVVRVELTGHLGIEMKEEYDEESAEQREKRLRNSVKSRIGAEVHDIRIESATDSMKPFVYSYKIKVPAYAERTGKRLFLQPAFFQKGVPLAFPSSKRQHAIYFEHPWSEVDEVEIALPEGYELDNADAPSPMNFGDAGSYEVQIGLTKDHTALVCIRKFQFSLMLVPKASYPTLKKAFDAIHEADNHVIALKQGTTAAASK